MNFLNSADLRSKSNEQKLFYSRLKAALTGNTDGFPDEIEGLTKLSSPELASAGYNREKFRLLDNFEWGYQRRTKSVVEDNEKRQMVLTYFEQDHISVANDPRSREVVLVEGEERIRRYFLDSVDNLVTRFLDEKPEFGSSRSSVKKILKSYKHFRYATEEERLHSICKVCRQLDMFVESMNLSEAFGEENVTRDQLVRMACCEGLVTEVSCIESQCVQCKDDEGKRKAEEGLKRLVEGSLNEEITWVIFAKDLNGKEGETQKFGSVRFFIENVANYLAVGCNLSGSGKKPIAHLHRLMEMKLERQNVFKQLDEDKDLVVLEFDHGYKNSAVIGMDIYCAGLPVIKRNV